MGTCSSLYGCVLPVQYHVSVQLECSLPQAVQLINLYLDQHNYTYLPVNVSRPQDKTRLTYCTGYELYVNEWDEAINQTIGQIHSEATSQELMARVNRVRQILSCGVANDEKTMVLVQLDLAVREQTQVVLNVRLAWHPEASARNTNQAHRVIRYLCDRFRQLHIHFHLLVGKPGAPARQANKTRLRPDTACKLEAVEGIRNRAKKDGQVTISPSRACREARLSLGTLKKWDPVLHARWSDPTY